MNMESLAQARARKTAGTLVTESSMDLKLGPLPLVLGVTGHRGLRSQDHEALRCLVTDIFAELQNEYPSTPIILLSPLAEGPTD